MAPSSTRNLGAHLHLLLGAVTAATLFKNAIENKPTFPSKFCESYMCLPFLTTPDVPFSDYAEAALSSKVFFSRALLSSEATENLIISRCSEVG